ncbi:MAG: hypothetical protein LUI10_01355 [Lachnospiraceae bacterium]|nr:hypothetical protein [Lachnospiraceae bacterium]
MAAVFTYDAENPDTELDFPAADKVRDPSLIIGMNLAASFIPTAGAYLQFRLERDHVGIKDVFRRFFYLKKLAKKCFFSYHNSVFCSAASQMGH